MRKEECESEEESEGEECEEEDEEAAMDHMAFDIWCEENHDLS